MNNTEPGYSTTRSLTTEKPIFPQNPDAKFGFSLFPPASEGRKGHGGLRTKGYFKHGLRKGDCVWNQLSPNGQFVRKVVPTHQFTPNELPVITVVIVVFNGGQYLEQAIQSVLLQSYANVEFIIIDGGSSDNTLDIINKYEDAIDYWISETDAGIYDAMNKAIAASSGQWIYFLGADDALYDQDVLRAAAQQMDNASKGDAMLIFGSVITDGGRAVRSKFGRKLLLHNSLHHQSCFYRRNVFDNIRYDASLRMISDYEVNLFAYLNGFCSLEMNLIVAMCRDGGVSTSRRTFSIYIAETDFVRNKMIKGFFGVVLKVLFNIKSRLYYAIRYF